MTSKFDVDWAAEGLEWHRFTVPSSREPGFPSGRSGNSEKNPTGRKENHLSYVSSPFSVFFKNPRTIMGCKSSKPPVARAIILGNDQSSGSTTFIERLYQGNVVYTLPTVGFNIQTINWYPVVVKPDFTAEEFKQAVEKRMKVLNTGIFIS